MSLSRNAIVPSEYPMASWLPSEENAHEAKDWLVGKIARVNAMELFVSFDSHIAKVGHSMHKLVFFIDHFSVGFSLMPEMVSFKECNDSMYARAFFENSTDECAEAGPIVSLLVVA